MSILKLVYHDIKPYTPTQKLQMYIENYATTHKTSLRSLSSCFALRKSTGCIYLHIKISLQDRVRIFLTYYKNGATRTICLTAK